MTVRLSTRENSISNRSIRNDDFRCLCSFLESVGRYRVKSKKSPGRRLIVQFFGAKAILQTRQYQAAHAADVSPGPDDSQSMRLIQLGNWFR